MSSLRTRIVVPCLRAIPLSVSPLLTKYMPVPEFAGVDIFPAAVCFFAIRVSAVATGIYNNLPA
ncbi:MAG: hypothetical protein AABY92_02575 [Thermodesulfobacteriota bacterium]